MVDQQVTVAESEWRKQIESCHALLESLRPQLIDAEAQLAERLAEISAFEFLVRSRFERLTQRLDKLQSEIDELRRQLRLRRFAWQIEDDFDGDLGGAASAWSFGKDGAAASGNFRYREQTTDFAPPVLPADQQDALRQLYRQLARRFHPDLALDEEERAHRTATMMRINAAYASGDLGELQTIALEPDPTPLAKQSDQQLAESLEREVERCRRRLAEIARELAELDRHESTLLLRRVERAAAEGRDLLDELASDLRQRISEKMVERDVLQTQLDDYDADDELGAESLADVLYDLGLEQAGAEDFMAEYDRWRAAKNQRWADEWSEDDIEDILDDHD